MSHLRKTKKRIRGGAQIVFVCRSRRTANNKCIPDFVKALHFKFTDVEPDGDCFFHTLELYYRRKQNMGANKNYRELRARIVNHIIENWGEYSIYGINQEDVLELTEVGVWDNDAGDLVVPASAKALGIRINIYDVKDAVPATANRTSQPKQVIKHIYPDPLPLPPPADTINILRIDDGHFGLLEPLPAPAPTVTTAAASRRKPVIASTPVSRTTAKKPNAVANVTKALDAMKLRNKAPSPAIGPTTRSRTRVTSPKRNNGTKRRASVKSNSNSSFEKEMRRAIEASKRVEVIARGAENVTKKAEAAAKKEAAKAKIAAKKAEIAAKKAMKKATNNQQIREAEELQMAIAESLKPIQMPTSFF